MTFEASPSHIHRIAAARYGEYIPHLVREERWIGDHVKRATALYPNQGLHNAAALLASVHPYAIDYLEQAPILALRATHGCATARSGERVHIATNFGSLCNRRLKLKDVLWSYRMPLPMRSIAGLVIFPSRYKLFNGLAKITPSRLAQSIPAKPGSQETWCRALSEWLNRMNGRRCPGAEQSLEWASFAFRDVTRAEVRKAADLADFAAVHIKTFNPKWILQNAEDAAERWHHELARRTDAEKFFREHGAEFSQKIDYSPFPDTASLRGYEIIALASGEDIFVEGAAMHHCAATYTREVIVGQAKLFSIRAGTRRVATVEARNIGGVYRLAQIKGPCNARVVKPIVAVAEEFIASVRKRRAA